MALAYMDQPTTIAKKYNRYQQFKVYDSFESCQECIADSTPLSLVLSALDPTMFGVVYKSHTQFAVHPIRFVKTSGGRVVLGL